MTRAEGYMSPATLISFNNMFWVSTNRLLPPTTLEGVSTVDIGISRVSRLQTGASSKIENALWVFTNRG